MERIEGGLIYHNYLLNNDYITKSETARTPTHSNSEPHQSPNPNSCFEPYIYLQANYVPYFERMAHLLNWFSSPCSAGTENIHKTSRFEHSHDD